MIFSAETNGHFLTSGKHHIWYDSKLTALGTRFHLVDISPSPCFYVTPH